HIVLSRDLANQGHYPAIDVLASSSRLMVNVVDEEDRECAKKAVALLSEYAKNKDMIDIGAYRAGMNAELDQAVRAMPELKRLLRQDRNESFTRAQAVRSLRAVVQTETRQ